MAPNLGKDIKFMKLDFDLYQPKSGGKVKEWFKTYFDKNRDILKDEEKTQSKIYSNQNGAILINKERETQSKTYFNQNEATLINKKRKTQSKL